MAPPLIDQVRLKNFGPIKDATLNLTALHALIGPNDSGKSMTLKALDRAFGNAGSHGDRPGITFPGNLGWSWDLRFAADKLHVSFADGKFSAESMLASRERLAGRAKFLRFDPDAMREEVPLLDDSKPFDFVNDRGRGLGMLLDALFARDPNKHSDLVKQVHDHFDTFQTFASSRKM
jgi:AAA ATPase domain